MKNTYSAEVLREDPELLEDMYLEFLEFLKEVAESEKGE